MLLMLMTKSGSRGLLCDQWGRKDWLSLLLPRLELQLAPPSTHSPNNCIRAQRQDGDIYNIFDMSMV